MLRMPLAANEQQYRITKLATIDVDVTYISASNLE